MRKSGHSDSLKGLGIDVGDIVQSRVYTIPHAGRLVSVAGERVVLIGDAAAIANPLSGEGIAYALAGGMMLGEALRSTTIENNGAVRQSLQYYQHRLHKRFAAHLRSGWIARRCMRHETVTTTVLRAAAARPMLQHRARDIMFSEGRLYLSDVARLAEAGIRSMVDAARLRS